MLYAVPTKFTGLKVTWENLTETHRHDDTIRQARKASKDKQFYSSIKMMACELKNLHKSINYLFMIYLMTMSVALTLHNIKW
jgi:hypothetical protein